jgi:hypothetical protein
MQYPLVKSETDRNWLKYCGFLDLSMDQFMSIQESLLRQQIEKVSQSRLGKKIMGKYAPSNMAEFRRLVPLTRYVDYLPELDVRDESSLIQNQYTWAQTSGGGSQFRNVPVTEEAYQKQLEHWMAIFILACSRARGRSSFAEGDHVLFNTAPQPALPGVLASGAARTFNMRSIVPPESPDKSEYREHLKECFETSLKTGMDILVAMSSVLVKTGLDFERQFQSGDFSRQITNPRQAYRIGKAYLKSKLGKRAVLPRDIWPLKALICWGIDSPEYRDEVYQHWGAYSYQFHACAEAGIMAVQTWKRQSMAFLPNSNFFEFISEEERAKSEEDMFYQPKTVLFSGVIPGQSYELVVTNYYGMPFLRYRLGQLIRIVENVDKENGIGLPQMVFEARVDELIDISGFTRICEKSINQALTSSAITCQDWVACRESLQGKPALHIYMELNGDHCQEELQSKLDIHLAQADPGYRDSIQMLDIHPVQVTLLKPGSFSNYSRVRYLAGMELVQQKPHRMNASEDEINELLGRKTQRLVNVVR